MPVKTYGIYVAYPPTVDLRAEGLGRYLASFLKGAAARRDVEFVIACPSWSHEMLLELFESEGVRNDRLTVLSPTGKPHLLRLFEAYRAFLGRARQRRIVVRIRAAALSLLEYIKTRLEERLAQSHSIRTAIPLLLEALALLILLTATSPLWIAFLLARVIIRLANPISVRILTPITRFRNWLQSLMASPQDDTWVFRMFNIMYEIESKRMLQLVSGLFEVSAWYCPTAFWPGFNLIDAPRLMCVPDVVLSEFPIGFSDVGSNRYLKTFETVQTAIRSADHMVTYSESVKWNTLVDRYGISAQMVHVIHHAPQDINRWVEISDFSDKETTSHIYCQQLLRQALQKSVNPAPIYASTFKNEEVQFLFYASQFRPNKNLLNLLRAYKYLLRRRLFSHKLILTGLLSDLPRIGEFIAENNLGNDVLCLHGLSVSELAACYKLSVLAVNPSLSEGGCPFTFTEALSVGTPVVMARIGVSEEVLDDPELQEMTFFDPYDWKDIASRIEWALENRDQLLDIQNKSYKLLGQRTWADVANEHIHLLEHISEKSGERVG